MKPINLEQLEAELEYYKRLYHELKLSFELQIDDIREEIRQATK